MKIIIENSKKFIFTFDKTVLNHRNKSSYIIYKRVKKIIDEVKKKGDVSLIRSIKKYDWSSITTKQLLVDQKKINLNAKKVDRNTFKSFKVAISRIYDYHRKQYPKNY